MRDERPDHPRDPALTRPRTPRLAEITESTGRPIVDQLDRWLARGLAVAAVFVGLILIFVGLGWIAMPSSVDQSRMLVERAPELLERTCAWADRWDLQASDRLLQSAETIISRFGNALISLPLTIISSIAEFVVVIFMSVYWLLSSDGLGLFLGSLLPPAMRGEFHRVAGEVGHAMGGYLRSESIGGLIVGVIVFICWP